jgi:predicted transcriptional regulator
MRAKDIMQTDFVRVRAEMPLREAVEIMLKANVPMLPVIHKECGRHSVLREVDVLRVVLPSYLDAVPSIDFLPEEYSLINFDKPLNEIQVMDVEAGSKLNMVEEDAKIVKVAHTMLVKGVSAVGVERNGEIVGFIRRSDLIRHYFSQIPCEKE